MAKEVVVNEQTYAMPDDWGVVEYPVEGEHSLPDGMIPLGEVEQNGKLYMVVAGPDLNDKRYRSHRAMLDECRPEWGKIDNEPGAVRPPVDKHGRRIVVLGSAVLGEEPK